MSDPWSFGSNQRGFQPYRPTSDVHYQNFRIPPPNIARPPPTSPFPVGPPAYQDHSQYVCGPPRPSFYPSCPTFIRGRGPYRQQDHVSPEKISSEKFLEEWMGDIEKDKHLLDQTRQREPDLKISDVQNMLLTYLSHIEKLEEYAKILDKSETDEDIEEAEKDILEIQAQIEIIMRNFESPEFIGRVKTSIEKRRDQRKRASKKKEEQREKKKREKERIEEKHRLIDNWRLGILENEQTKLQEEKLKKEADHVLGEVKGKQEDIKRMKKLLEKLVLLRKVRLQNAEMKGIAASSESNESFHSLIGKLTDVIVEQEEQYRLEEATLKSMMEDSPLQSSQPPKKSLQLPGIQQEIREIYMGKGDTEDQFYKQAEESLPKLIEIRRGWDKYISEDVMSSSIPLGFIVPNMNPNEDWKRYLEN